VGFILFPVLRAWARLGPDRGDTVKPFPFARPSAKFLPGPVQEVQEDRRGQKDFGPVPKSECKEDPCKQRAAIVNRKIDRA
jgi:hypothetical protein